MIRIQKEPGRYVYLSAAEAISHLAVVEINPVATRYVQTARVTTPELVAGVNIGTAVSGKLAHILVNGIASGVKCGGTVNMGDRLIVASGGYVQAMNSITPAGTLGGGGFVSGFSAASGIQAISGYATIVSGVFTGTAWNTGKIFARALASGSLGQGIPALITLGG